MLTAASGHIIAPLGFWTPGAPEIVIIVLALLLLFGGKKLPELARGLGRGLRTFKRELQGVKTDEEEDQHGNDAEGQGNPEQTKQQRPPDDSQQA
jgi:sec-independent protein translocase protein TatA